MVTFGQVVAYAIGAGFFNVQSGWRWMVGLSAVPAGIQFILLFLLPESRTPSDRWVDHNHFMLMYHPIARILLHRRDISGAREVMRRIYAHAGPEDLDLKVFFSSDILGILI